MLWSALGCLAEIVLSSDRRKGGGVCYNYQYFTLYCATAFQSLWRVHPKSKKGIIFIPPRHQTLQDLSKENLRAHRQNLQKIFFLQALKYYDMSLDAYRKQNMYGFGLTIVVLKNKANAKYDLEQYEEALKMADEVFDYYVHIQQPMFMLIVATSKVCVHVTSPPPCPSKCNIVPMVMDTLMGKNGLECKHVQKHLVCRR